MPISAFEMPPTLLGEVAVIAASVAPSL